MAESDFTYADLDAFLRSYGFEMTEKPGSHRQYRHQSGALIMYPLAPLTRKAQHFHLAEARIMLDDYGFVPAEDFQRSLESARRVAS